jgi:uncharacterized BrkB/YihY/UPF0761 family membrane protein
LGPYFSVLSLVPVTMVAFAAAGFALGARPAAVERLQHEITTEWPERSATSVCSPRSTPGSTG